MTKRKPFTARVPEETHSQIEKLAARLGTKTSVIILAVRDLYRRELGRRVVLTGDEDEILNLAIGDEVECSGERCTILELSYADAEGGTGDHGPWRRVARVRPVEDDDGQ